MLVDNVSLLCCYLLLLLPLLLLLRCSVCTVLLSACYRCDDAMLSEKKKTKNMWISWSLITWLRGCVDFRKNKTEKYGFSQCKLGWNLLLCYGRCVCVCVCVSTTLLVEFMLS